MPCPSALRPNLSAARVALGRLGAWLGTLALVVQLLVPLSQPQAAWVEDGLFPPTCSVHQSDAGSATLPDADQCAQCPLCQLHAGDRVLVVPLRRVEAAFAAPLVVMPPTAALSPPRAVAAQPPLPSRGPPSAA